MRSSIFSNQPFPGNLAHSVYTRGKIFDTWRDKPSAFSERNRIPAVARLTAGRSVRGRTIQVTWNNFRNESRRTRSNFKEIDELFEMRETIRTGSRRFSIIHRRVPIKRFIFSFFFFCVPGSDQRY